MHLFLDIETVPGQAPGLREELATSVRPPATLKKPESIAAWERDDKPAAIEEAWLKTSFDGTYGQLCVVGVAVGESDPSMFAVGDLSTDAERKMLSEVYTHLQRAYSGTSGSKPVLVGHNLVSFDLPFLWRRSVVLGVKPPFWWPRNVKPWTDAVYDTMTQWAGDRGTIGLDRLCRALGLAGKGDGPTGADVWPMVQAGRIGEVVTYCAADIERTRAIWRRLTFSSEALQ